MSHYELQFSMDGKNRLELKEYIKKKWKFMQNHDFITILSPLAKSKYWDYKTNIFTK